VVLVLPLLFSVAAPRVGAVPASGHSPRLQGAQADRQVQLLLRNLDTYKDHLERRARCLSLLEAIRLGLEQNPALAEGYAQLQQSQWQAIAIQREGLPSLQLFNDDPGLIGWRRETDRDSRTDTVNGTSLTCQTRNSRFLLPKLQLQWTFFDPSRTPRLRAQQATSQANRLLFDISARNLVLDIQRNYYALQRSSELEADYRHLSELIHTLVVMALAKQGRNPADHSVVEQLKSEELALLILCINAHEQVIRDAAQLASLLSLPPGQLVMPSERLQRSGSWGPSLEQTIEKALAFREEIQASLAQADSSSWSARAVLSASLPSFALVGKSTLELEAYGQQNVPTPSSTTTGTNSTFTNEAGLFFAWKPFDGGINAALSTAWKKRAEQSIQQAALDRLTVTNQVEASHAALLNSLIVIDTAQDQLRASGRALEAFRGQFARGADNATTLIQTIQGYTKAVESYRNSVSKHNSAIAELYLYSAQWPETALPLLQRRVDQLARD
jgi:outer membrane protein TolC